MRRPNHVDVMVQQPAYVARRRIPEDSGGWFLSKFSGEKGELIEERLGFRANLASDGFIEIHVAPIRHPV